MTRSLLALLLASTLALPLAAQSEGTAPGLYGVNVETDEGTRRVVVQVPSNRSETPVPLVLALHGGGSSAEAFASEIGGLLDAADQRGWIVVLPDGTPCLGGGGLCWNARPDDAPSFRRSEADDVAFLRAVIAEMEGTGAIDPARVYVTGFSNGADMTYRFAAEAPDAVAAAAPVAGTTGRTISKSEYSFSMAPTPTGPVPVLIVKGMQDGVYPYFGGAPGLDYDVLNAEYDANFWAEANGCDLAGVVEEGTTFIADQLDGSYATHTYDSRAGCRAAVQLVSVGAMAHEWPTAAQGYDATQGILVFFEGHGR